MFIVQCAEQGWTEMRLIDVDELLQEFDEWNADLQADSILYSLSTTERQLGMTDAMVIASQMPTVDAVPVVRCKDCIYHFYDKKYDVQYCSRKDYGYGWKDDDYCSMAVRKKNETD